MDCNDARPLLDANVDRELSPPDARELQQHIEGCAACQRDSDAVRALGAVVRAAGYHRAPDALRARIVGSLPATRAAGEADQQAGQRRGSQHDEPHDRPLERPHEKPRFRWLDFVRGVPQDRAAPRGRRAGAIPLAWPMGAGWRGGALALLICAVVAAGVTLTLRRSAEPAVFVDELVSSHVRAQLSGRDLDVVSSDQHTVKPWFNGRIDYAPPVVDLAASGFPLAGGRLDYVGHRRVAVLTYLHRKHVIDVYVLPDTDPAAGKPGPSIVHDGYAVARWRDDGMMWWAVTDAAPESLTSLEAALRARLQAGG
ncbi:MAG TPA: zf-HC2 domain-containing protein [Paraburkholderia sp.]